MVILEEILRQIEEPRLQNQYNGVEQYNRIIFPVVEICYKNMLRNWLRK